MESNEGHTHTCTLDGRSPHQPPALSQCGNCISWTSVPPDVQRHQCVCACVCVCLQCSVWALTWCDMQSSRRRFGINDSSVSFSNGGKVARPELSDSSSSPGTVRDGHHPSHTLIPSRQIRMISLWCACECDCVFLGVPQGLMWPYTPRAAAQMTACDGWRCGSSRFGEQNTNTQHLYTALFVMPQDMKEKRPDKQTDVFLFLKVASARLHLCDLKIQ